MTKSKSAPLPSNKFTLVGEAVPVDSSFDMSALPFTVDQPAPEQPKPQKGEFSKGFGRSFAEIPGMAAGVAAYGADVVGADDIRDSLLGYAKGRQDKVQAEYGSDAASFTNVMDGKAGWGDFLANASGYVAGQALMSLATGGLGAMGAKFIAKQGIAKLGQQAAEQVIASEVAKGVSKEAAMATAQAAAADAMKAAALKAGWKGAAVAGGAQNFGMELGSIYPDAVDQATKEGRKLDAGDLARVGGAAAGAAALETAADVIGAKRILGQGKAFDSMVGDGSKYLRRAAVEVPLGMARESGTEGLQTVAERFGAGQSLNDAEAKRDIIDSVAVGAVGGGQAGVVSAIHKQQKDEVPPVNPVADALNTAASQPDSPLSRAALAVNPHLAAAPAADPISSMASSVEQQLSGTNVLDTMRGMDPNMASALLGALATAKNTTLPAVAREKAAADISGIMQSYQLRGATAAGQQWQAMQGNTPEQDLSAQRDQVGRIDAVGQQWQDMGMSTPAQDLQQQKEQHQADVANQAGEAWKAIAPSIKEEGDSSGVPDRVQPQQGAVDGTQANQAQQAETQRQEAPAAEPVAPVVEPVDRKTVALPEMNTPRGGGPAVIRKAKAQVAELAAQGFDTVERRGNTFWMVNHRRNEEVQLDGMAMSQMARVAIKQQMDALAAQANTNPTEAQKLAENYKKGHLSINGFDVSVENPAGSTRSGTSPDGTKWETTMPHHYGNFKRTTGADGDAVDTFVGPRPDSDKIFVVDQLNKDGSFDEHKVMQGFLTAEDAKAGYMASYEPGWTGFGGMTEMSVPQFKEWLNSPASKKPAAQYDAASNQEATNVGRGNQAAADATASMAEGSAGVADQQTGGPQLAPRVGDGVGNDTLAAEGAGYAAPSRAAQEAAVQRLKESARGRKRGNRVALAGNGVAAKQLNALLDAFASLTGVRGLAVKWDDGPYGAQHENSFFVNTEDPDMHVAQTIGHEFKHLANRYPGIQKLYDRLWSMIDAPEARARYWAYLQDSSQIPMGDKLEDATDRQMELLKDEMIADFMGQRFNDRAWLEDLAKKKPALFGEFVRDWIKILGDLIAKLRGHDSQSSSVKNVDQFISRLEEAKQIAMEVAEQWALANPKLSESTGASDVMFSEIQRDRAAMQEALQKELDAANGVDDAPSLEGFGHMAEEAYPPIKWAKNGSSYEKTAMVTDGVRKERLEMSKDHNSDLWQGSIRGTWIGPTIDEADGYATERAVKKFLDRQLAGRMLKIRGFDLASTVSPEQKRSLLNAAKTISSADGARRYGRPTKAGSFKDVADTMTIDAKYVVSVTRMQDDSGDSVLNVEFLDKKNKFDSYGLATLTLKKAGGKRFLEANTSMMGKSGLGGAFYQMAAEYAAANNMQLRPEDSLSGINTYRRTEQMLSAALRTGRSNVMVPHDTQRVYGFNNNALSIDQHNDNLVRMMLASIRNAKEILGPAFDLLTYTPETGSFADKNGKNLDEVIKRVLAGADARALGMGRSTLARAVMLNSALNGEEVSVTKMKEPVLYSERATAESEYAQVVAQYKGTPEWMMTPTGEKTKLEERQWVQVRTPSFKKWFGDWEQAHKDGGVWATSLDVSKAVGKDGEPLVLYHGTDKGGFMSFNQPGGKDRGDLGIFTTDNYSMARSYVRRGRLSDITPPVNEEDLSSRGYSFEPEDDGSTSYVTPDGYLIQGFASKEEAVEDALRNWEGDEGASTVYAVFMNIRNPNESNFEGANWDGTRHDQYIVEVGGEQQFDEDGRGYFTQDEALERAKAFVSPEDAEEGIEADYYVRAADDHYESTDSVVREGWRHNHDGAIIREVQDDGGGSGSYSGEPSDVFVATDSAQIKSAEFNTGEFGPSSNIRYSEDTDNKYWLQIEREVREHGKWAGLSKDEKAVIATAVKDNNLTEAQEIALGNAVRYNKKRHPTRAGWAPISLVGATVEKKENKKGELIVKVTPKYQAISYNFHIPPGAKRAPNKVDQKHATNVAKKFYDLIIDIYDRAANGDENAKRILVHKNWYRDVSVALRKEYGGFGDVLSDLMGATSPNTPVNTNWRFSIDVMQRFVRGDFKREMDAFVAHLDSGKTPGSFKKVEGAEQIRQVSGKLYGMNSTNAMVALANLWRMIEPGSAPKAKNFALNLIGQSNMATIDVWAARMLRRAANEVRGMNLPRIPPVAEQGVSGVWNADATQVGGEFGFGAAVMDRVSAMLKDHGKAVGQETLFDVSPPDLQAIAWFAEKELWGTKNWTTKDGEGGSFIENIENDPADRWIAGWSVQIGTETPEKAVVADAQKRVSTVLAADKSVVALRVMPTLGLYGDTIEQSFDTEWVVAKNKPYDPTPVMLEIASIAKERSQLDIFVSRVVDSSVNNPNARPGVELYFKTAQGFDAVKPILDEFTSRGQDGFTLSVDPRAKVGSSEYIGVRLQYVPEISMRWEESLRTELLKDGAIEQVLKEKRQALNDITAEITTKHGDVVSYAKVYKYDTVVVGKENYDGFIAGRTAGGDRSAGGEVWFGQPIRQGLEAAARRLSAQRGQVDGGGVSDVGGELRASEREVQGRGSDILRGGARSAGGQRQAPRYGKQVEGGTSSVAYHFSKGPRTSLDANFYGSGLQGAESERLAGAANADIRPRAFFYVDVGNGIRPEFGVGPFGHHVQLEGLYDVDADQQGIVRKNPGANNWERAILKAGFTGYITRPDGFPQGFAVALGSKHSSIPVEETMVPGAKANPVITRKASTNETRREGDELVRKPEQSEEVGIYRARKNVSAVAPSFRPEFGHWRVKESEAATADQALLDSGSSFQFGQPAFSERLPGFFSELGRQVGLASMKQAPAGAWKSYINALVTKGVKPEEIEWTGINDWLDLKAQPQTVYEPGFGVIEEYKDQSGNWVQADDIGRYFRTKEEALASITDRDHEIAKRDSEEQGAEFRIGVGPFDALDLGKTVTNKISKEEVQEYLKSNGVQVQEVVLGRRAGAEEAARQAAVKAAADFGYELEYGMGDGEALFSKDGEPVEFDELPEELQTKLTEAYDAERDVDATPSKYAQYTLPGGENYREVLLTLPSKESVPMREQFSLYDESGELFSQGMWPPSHRTQDQIDEHPEWRVERTMVPDMNAVRKEGKQYISSHWDQPNVLAHIRVNDRIDADGKRVLFVEELQSDWGQSKKRGGHVPDAPFIGKTEGWLNLSLKRIIKMAADGGYDKVAFINGEQSADRYNLAKVVDYVEYQPDGKGSYFLKVMGNTGQSILTEYNQTPAQLEEKVGKDLAKQIVNHEGKLDKETDNYILRAKDFVMGGEGMKAFYDKIVPNAVNNLLKKLGGGKLGVLGMPARDSIRGGEEYTYSMLTTADGKNYVTDLSGKNRVAGPFEDYDTAHQWLLTHDPVLQSQQPSFDVTDALSTRVSTGLPLFSERSKADLASAQERQDKPKEGIKLVKYLGLKVDVPVKIEETGEVATLTMDVNQTLDDYAERISTMSKLLSCLA